AQWREKHPQKGVQLHPCLQGQTSGAQRRREGNTLHIQCPYTAWGIEREIKYWCLLKDGRYQFVVYTYSGSQRKNGRIQIQDDTTNKTVSITMTDLKAEDSGTYFCTYSSCAFPRIKTISLNVFKGEYLYPTQSQPPRQSHTHLAGPAGSLLPVSPPPPALRRGSPEGAAPGHGLSQVPVALTEAPLGFHRAAQLGVGHPVGAVPSLVPESAVHSGEKNILRRECNYIPARRSVNQL
uniref:Ig-like domain-containing protein n=1 Tax=Ficedula albicollis TaxID=59894 RepID=A0A803W541_FICAL